jgi:hypothetical protein
LHISTTYKSLESPWNTNASEFDYLRHNTQKKFSLPFAKSGSVFFRIYLSEFAYLHARGIVLPFRPKDSLSRIFICAHFPYQ